MTDLWQQILQPDIRRTVKAANYVGDLSRRGETNNEYS